MPLMRMALDGIGKTSVASTARINPVISLSQKLKNVS